jgi:hypothetical protein
MHGLAKLKENWTASPKSTPFGPFALIPSGSAINGTTKSFLKQAESK